MTLQKDILKVVMIDLYSDDHDDSPFRKIHISVTDWTQIDRLFRLLMHLVLSISPHTHNTKGICTKKDKADHWTNIATANVFGTLLSKCMNCNGEKSKFTAILLTQIFAGLCSLKFIYFC